MLRMKRQKIRKRDSISLPDVEKLHAELKDFAAEFDDSDPSWTEVMLDTHISNLIDRGTIKARWWRRNLRLDDAFERILKGHATDDLMERVRMFQDLINDYRGEPSKEDMVEARDILNELLEELAKYLKEAKKADAEIAK